MFLQSGLFDLAKKKVQDGYFWMGLPNKQSEKNILLTEVNNGGKPLFGKYASGFSFDSGIVASRTLSITQNYMLALLLTPFDVVGTLQSLQFQPKFEVVKEELGVKAQYWFGKREDGYLPLLQHGTWESVREIVEFPKGGVTFLIRGHFTSLIYRTLYIRSNLYIEEALNDLLNIYKKQHPATLFISHFLIAFILYPIDIIKTCLIIQSSDNTGKSYQGPIHMLYSAISKTSYKFLAVYNPRYSIFPAVVISLGPLLGFLSETAISQYLGLNSLSGGILYYAVRVGFLALEAAILSPLNLIKKRLDIQLVKKRVKPVQNNVTNRIFQNRDTNTTTSLELFDFQTSVFLYPEPYTGVIDCLVKTTSLEGGGGFSNIANPQVLPLKYTLNMAKSTVKLSSISAKKEPVADVTHSKYINSASNNTPARKISKTGINSLFRGFWAMYLNKILSFALDEINKKPQTFPWMSA